MNVKQPREYRIHKILMHSYVTYFILFLIGICLDFLFPLKIFQNTLYSFIGVLFLVFSTIVILWAQKTSRNLDIKNLSKETFCKGPYCYTRTPTHWGLFFLMIGFGLLINAFFVVLTSVISFLFSKFIFIDKQERILAEKYGAPYLEYKKKIHL